MVYGNSFFYTCKQLNEEILLQVKKKSLAQLEDQHNFRIFYVKLVKNISAHMNHVWETYRFTPILCKSLLIGKNVPCFDDLAKCFNSIFNKQNIILKLKYELQRISHITKGFFLKTV